ncbi:MAG: hypothetical protein HFJ10_01385 [Lachnospiraceae bacterium]|nr:hypothetical protein [Lachnospiraceae bacterium]
MGLDIYAGTLTRYYAHNWKSVTQQWAEANGFSFSRITSQGETADGEEVLSPAEIQKGMENWQSQMLTAISSQDRPPYTPWKEDNETPYYTDKPDWDAFGALLLYAASRIYQEPLPKTVEKNWDFESHPLIQRMGEDEEKIWSLFIGAIWWLPIEDGFAFNGPCPTEQEITFSTTGALKMELNEINAVGWKADEKTILGWTETEGYPADMDIRDGQLTGVSENEHTCYDTESLAKFAFSIFWRAVKFAQENQVPILLDF